MHNKQNYCCFSSKFERIIRKNQEGNSNILTISAQYGLINQLEYYNQQYASEDTSGYTLLKSGEFAYNKSYSDGYPWGAIKRLSRYDDGIVSPIYLCFAAKSGTCAEFYEQYFESGLFNREIYRIAQEGARNHGLLNIAAEDFFKTALIDPPLEEQKRIAEILECCDKVIRLKRELLEEKKKQKKSLMQKLLNPDSGFRLPGFKGEWKEYKISQIATIESGGTPATNISEYWNGNIPWCTPSDISMCTKYLNKTESSITEDGLKKSSAIVLPIGSVVMCSRASIGPHAITTISISTNQGFKNFICSKLLDNEFWYYFIDTLILDFQRLAAGNTFLEISKNSIETFKVIIPEIREQKAIANILTAADREIDLLEQDLSQWEQKKKSLMQLLLTGKVRT